MQFCGHLPSCNGLADTNCHPERQRRISSKPTSDNLYSVSSRRRFLTKVRNDTRGLRAWGLMVFCGEFNEFREFREISE